MESRAQVKDRIQPLIHKLRELHPDARYELDFDTPLQLLVATILAAQCTDERVNRVTRDLFPRYPSARAYADAPLEVLEEQLKPTGFFRQKAKTVKAVCQALCDTHDGEVPEAMAELVKLPGVARKTANVVLTMAFGIPSGIIVDTHVARVSQRMGLVRSDKPEKIEEELMALVPQGAWIHFGPAMVLHGRYTCTAKSPACAGCPVFDLCERRL